MKVDIEFFLYSSNVQENIHLHGTLMSKLYFLLPSQFMFHINFKRAFPTVPTAMV